MNQKQTFDELIRKIEREEFPEFREEDIIGGFDYMCFAPSWHIKSGLLTRTIVQELKRGKNLLSVGSGPAYLERLLSSRFDVEANNILLSDKFSRNIPKGFEYEEFDMHLQWPQFGRGFDYIIFPESLCSLADYKTNEMVERVVHLFRQSLINLNPNGQARFDGYVADRKKTYNEGIQRTNLECPSARLTYGKWVMILSGN